LVGWERQTQTNTLLIKLRTIVKTESMAIDVGTVVEHSSHHPKVEGSSPATPAGTKNGRENDVKEYFLFYKTYFENAEQN
jgi:hypothetical protein